MASQVWLITGTSSGFGAAFVHEALARGDKVIATARNLSKISALAEAGAAVLQLDVTSSSAELEKKAQEAIAIYGRVDVLVNNAGYSHFSTFEDATVEDWQSQLETNFFGAVKVTRAFLPHFRQVRAGTIVFIGSAAAIAGFPTCSLYCASKWALTGAAEALQEETKSFGIRTLVVQPGFFRTDLLKENNVTYLETKIDDYQPMIEGAYEQYKGVNGKQPGDPVKGASRVVDVVKGQGLAFGKKFPQTLMLGSDVLAMARKRCEDTLKSLQEWEDVSSNLDV